MMVTCISTQLQTFASRPHDDDKFLLSNFNPKFSRVRMLTSFKSCSMSSSNNHNLFVDHRSIINSSSHLFPFCNLFDGRLGSRKKFNLMQTLSRMLASSVLLLAVMTMALFCMQDSACAASYGRMGGSSSSSSSSSSSDDYYIYDDDDDSGCNCKTQIEKSKRRSCTKCDCYKEKEKGKDESCSDCNCYKQQECSNENNSSSSSNSLPTNCDCNCHKPCECSCHVPVKTIATPMFIIFFIGIVICVIVEELKKADNVQTSGRTGLDNRWGSVIMVQVGILDKKRGLQRKLNRIAGTANTVTRSGLKRLSREVVRSIFEHHDHCHFAYLFANYGHLEKYSRPCFRGFLEKEVGKFDKNDETFVNVDGVKYRKESVGKVNSIDNEYLVVTLIMLVDGEYLIPSPEGYTTHVKKVDIETALRKIHVIPMSNLEAVEVLWTPQMENDVVTEQEVCRDFGLLMRPVDLTE